MYRVFSSRSANLVDALGLSRLLPTRRIRYRELWALRGVDFELARGERLGIIGRNGAGKTTLLKLITGAIAPTEGTIETRGTVQAMLEASAGLHPEFTGWENIRAALTYQGFNQSQIQAAGVDIAEFTELGSFLEQPFRTYSLGMQARLGFAIATAVQPEILVVDEVLGAGDAYFLTKSIGRMSRLIEGGASVLMVSHALDHITRFCTEVMWLERGQVMERGPAIEVVKSYDQFIRVLEERKLKARNRKVGRNGAPVPAEHLIVRLRASGDPGREACDLGAVRLLADDTVEDEVVVGGPQDSEASHSAALLLEEGESWSPPRGARGATFRTLTIGADGTASASARFELDGLSYGTDHALELVYRSRQTGALEVQLVRGGGVVASKQLPASDGSWERVRIPLPVNGATDPGLVEWSRGGPGQAETRRWPGEGSLMIDAVEVLDGSGRERAIFDVETPLVLRIVFSARCAGRFELIPAAVLFRLDGILVSRFVGDRTTLELADGERREAVLRLGPLNLGDGEYLFSVALYKELDVDDVEPAQAYDLLDRSYQFQVVGTPPLERGIFRHPGGWTIA
jgi:lipopolysaccharide transport system ATP-binding protein